MYSVLAFTQLAAHGKNLTIDDLRCRQNWVLDWCFMCKRVGETVDHLMLHCEYAQELWSMVFRGLRSHAIGIACITN